MVIRHLIGNMTSTNLQIQRTKGRHVVGKRSVPVLNILTATELTFRSGTFRRDRVRQLGVERRRRARATTPHFPI
jgi:hypothetical protein